MRPYLRPARGTSMLGRRTGSMATPSTRFTRPSRLGGTMTQSGFAGSRAPRVLLLLLASLFAAPVARAQQGTISGTIVDARSGIPIPDVSVAVDGATSIARSGTRGEFRLTNIPGATARLRATRIGYQATQV